MPDMERARAAASLKSTATLAAVIAAVVLPAPAAVAALPRPAATAGATWAPTTEGVVGLSVLSCPAAGECVAMGSPPLSGADVVETLSSGRWARSTIPASLPILGPGPGELSCTSVTSCVLVGDSPSGPVAETLSAGGWTATVLPLSGLSPPPDSSSNAQLRAVSCSALGSCVAIGSYDASVTGGTQIDSFFEALSGGTWTASTAPTSAFSPPIGNDQPFVLNQIACPTSVNCVAVGPYTSGSGFELGIETLSGGTWTATTAPTSTLSPPAQGVLGNTALGCAAAGACAFAGSYGTSSGATEGLIETLSSGTWAANTVPLTGLHEQPAAQPDVQFNGMSCGATGTCTAVGNYTDTNASIDPLVANVSSGVVTSRDIVTPATGGGNATSGLGSVDCVAATTCVAVGGWSDAGGEFAAGLIATESSGTWSEITSPVDGLEPPPSSGLPAISLSPVACRTAAFCVALGSYDTSTGGNESMILTLRTPTTTSVSAPLSSVVGAPVALSATVRASLFAPVGELAFRDGSKVLCTAPLVPSGVTAKAACKATGAPVGSETVTASYGGSADTEPSTGTAHLTVYPAQGFWLATAAGAVFAAGAAPSLGGVSSGGATPQDPVAGIAGTPAGNGYVVATANGTVQAFGAAKFYGDLPSMHIHPNLPVVAIAETADGDGYWLLASDGGFFAFGDAKYRGSVPGLGEKVSDVVAMEASPVGIGYWIAGSDGKVWNFGSAAFYGDLPSLHVQPNRPIVAMLPSSTGKGYVLVASDGGAFKFGGGVHFYGSLPGIGVKVADVIGLALTPDDGGYFIAAADGLVWVFGDAKAEKTPVGLTSHLPVVAIAGV